MRRDLVTILACPVCKGPLGLTVGKEEQGEVLMGSLRCEKCPETYPIVDAIPNLLPPSLRTTS